MIMGFSMHDKMVTVILEPPEAITMASRSRRRMPTETYKK